MAGSSDLVPPGGRWQSDLPNFTPRRLKARLTAWYLALTANRLRKRDLARAEALYRRAVALVEQAFGPESAVVLPRLSELAAALYDREEYSEAEAAYRRIIDIMRRTLGSTDPQTAWNESRLAMVLSDQGRFDEANDLLVPALAVYERALGRSQPHTAYMLDALGEVAYRQARYRDAEGLFRRSLAIRRRRGKTEWLRWTQGRLAQTLADLGVYQSNQGKLAEAEAVLTEARTLAINGFGARHGNTGTVTGALGWVKHQQGMMREAERLCRERYEIYRDAGEDTERRAYSGEYLGIVLRDEARFDEAQEFLQEALSRREALSERDRDPLKISESLDVLAGLEVTRGRYAEADQHAARALALLEDRLGPTNRALTRVLYTLA